MVVTLITCKDEFEAEVVKGALADVGIESILQGKHMSQIYGGIGAMSVNVLVDEKDYEKALQVVNANDEQEDKERSELAETANKPDVWSWKEVFVLFFAMFLYNMLFRTLIDDYLANCSVHVKVLCDIVSLLVCFIVAKVLLTLIKKVFKK